MVWFQPATPCIVLLAPPHRVLRVSELVFLLTKRLISGASEMAPGPPPHQQATTKQQFFERETPLRIDLFVSWVPSVDFQGFMFVSSVFLAGVGLLVFKVRGAFFPFRSEHARFKPPNDQFGVR